MESVGYTVTCILCKNNGKVMKYVGETARSLYLRSKEHWALMKRKAQSSSLHSHNMEYHRGQEPDYTFEVHTTYQDDTLARQTNEGVRIWQGEALRTSINSRLEYNHPGLVRAVRERQ